MGHDLDQLVHEGVQDMLGNHFNGENKNLPPRISAAVPLPLLPSYSHAADVHLPTLPEGQPLPIPPSMGQENGEAAPGGDLISQMRETNGSGVPSRPRRRAAVAAANFATDVEGSDEESGDDGEDDDADAATGSSGRPEARLSKRRRAGGNSDAPAEKKSHIMKGRFSGRLPTKDDERRLADECSLMGHLLSEEGDLSTLPNIIRAMAKGTVRAHLEREHAIKEEAMVKLATLQAHSGAHGPNLMSLAEENLALKTELTRAQNHITDLQNRLQNSCAEGNQLAEEQQVAQTIKTLPATTAIAGGLAVSMAANSGALQLATLPTTVAMPPATQVMLNAAPANALTATHVVQVPAAAAAAAGLQAGQVVQMAAAPEAQAATLVTQQVLQNGMAQPVVVAAVQPAVTTASMLRVPSSAQLVAAAAQQQMQSTEPVTVVSTEPAAGADADPAAAAAGVAATNLNEHAQQLAVTASLHGVAKTEAAVQAQHLAVQAQQHAQASVQAAQQAEELKKTIYSLPHSEHVHQAAVTVQNLEARAQAHASITTQVVAQARDMHEKAQAHEKEQLKAINQATVLQAHAQSLHASAVQLESSGAPPSEAPPVTMAPTQLAPVTAPLPTLTAIQQQQQPVSSVGLPCGSAGGPLASSEVPQPAAPSGLPTTPHSAASGGSGMFAPVVPAATAAQVSLVAAQQLPVGQQVHLVVQQPAAVVPQIVPLQATADAAANLALAQQQAAAAVLHQPAAMPPPQLYHQQSGDHMADAAALQQQIAVLQAQQAQVQVVGTVPAPTRPPVTVQLLSAPAAGMHHSQSHSVLPLVHAGSNSVPADASSVQVGGGVQVAPQGSVALPMEAPAVTALVDNAAAVTAAAVANSMPQQHQIPGNAVPTTSLDLPSGIEGILPSAQHLATDISSALPTAGMGPGERLATCDLSFLYSKP